MPSIKQGMLLAVCLMVSKFGCEAQHRPKFQPRFNQLTAPSDPTPPRQLFHWERLIHCGVAMSNLSESLNRLEESVDRLKEISDSQNCIGNFTQADMKNFWLISQAIRTVLDGTVRILAEIEEGMMSLRSRSSDIGCRLSNLNGPAALNDRRTTIHFRKIDLLDYLESLVDDHGEELRKPFVESIAAASKLIEAYRARVGSYVESIRANSGQNQSSYSASAVKNHQENRTAKRAIDRAQIERSAIADAKTNSIVGNSATDVCPRGVQAGLSVLAALSRCLGVLKSLDIHVIRLVSKIDLNHSLFRHQVADLSTGLTGDASLSRRSIVQHTNRFRNNFLNVSFYLHVRWQCFARDLSWKTMTSSSEKIDDDDDEDEAESRIKVLAMEDQRIMDEAGPAFDSRTKRCASPTTTAR